MKKLVKASVASAPAPVPVPVPVPATPVGHFNDKDDEKPKESWKHYKLWSSVRDCLFSLPEVFDLGINLPALPAKDLPSANTLLGSAIEDHIPTALNKLRSVWDEDGDHADLIFKRQPQTFPDVVLVRAGDANPKPLFGIEVKSWYLLAGEKEPSFRMQVNRDYCHDCDLAMVVPWALSYGVAGGVRLFRPIVISARKAARIRNHYWQELGHGVTLKAPAANFVGYPSKANEINDLGEGDGGNNFGRITRTGVWKEDIEALYTNERISGITLGKWQKFLKEG